MLKSASSLANLMGGSAPAPRIDQPPLLVRCLIET